MNQELYNDLFNLRAGLKLRYSKSERTPAICTDAALRELARLAPKTKEELELVPGLGKNFVNNYGDEFMRVLDFYHNRESNDRLLSGDVKAVLKNLENRLVNINKKNRLLYQGKLHTKYSFDLYSKNEERNSQLARHLLNKTNRPVTLCKMDGDDKPENEKTYNKILTLLREVNKDLRESGQYDLYVGFPYVIGKMQGENFNVKAPLALFPVEVKLEAGSMALKLDFNRDILFNNSLILSHNKFNFINKELPANVVQSDDKKQFITELFNFYSENGINLKGEIGNLEKFTECGAEDFSKLVGGEYRIINNAVLGKFSIYSSALQKDFKDIIDGSQINELLSELLENAGEVDLFSDEAAACVTSEADCKIKEQDLFYITELNSSQENAMVQIARNKNLVIQGPPGTGKSQTITSIIADFVSQGKQVAMVSQKKAAIDVIYSRLGSLSKYAVMIDDVKDKESFYSQLSNLYYKQENNCANKDAFRGVSFSIDNQMEKLEDIAAKLYSEDENGNVMYKIYQENTDNVYLQKDYEYLAALSDENVDDSILKLKYQEFKNLKHFFENGNTLFFANRYFVIKEKFPWIEKVKNSLGILETAKMMQAAVIFEESQKNYRELNIFKRMAGSRRQKKELDKFLKQYFVDKTCRKLFFKQPSVIGAGLQKLEEYLKAKTVVDTFSRVEFIYSQNLSAINEALKIDINYANIAVYDYLVFRLIDNFETHNRAILNDIDNHQTIIKNICGLLSKKKEVSKELLKSYLSAYYKENILSSKRIGEMQRIIESKRKWNVSRFIKKFSFELFKGIKIWMMTPETVSEIMPLSSDLFDLLVFDEASQLYVEKGVPAIARAKKVLIVGDHKQLRPSNLGSGRADFNEDLEIENEEDADAAAALEEESLLDLARFKFPSVILNYHYRSKYEELISFSNYAFYQGRLHVSPNNGQINCPPIEIVKVSNGLWSDRANKPEAEQAVSTLKEYMNERSKNQTIGIITFNSAQRDLIMDLLDAECAKDPEFAASYQKELLRKENGEDVGLFIKNIENVQGDERDCIIFSLAYAKNAAGKVVRNFGWLNQQGGENRLNVAISRAKEKIFVVTSIVPEELHIDGLTNEGPKVLRKYLQYAYAVHCGDKLTASAVLSSFDGNRKGKTEDEIFYGDFETLVYDTLISCGFDVERQVGIGDYKIDLAIKSGDKYVLGIECDGRLYSDSGNARERDIHRQKYLESRGWKMHRIWSTNWWHDRSNEIEKIKSMIYS